MSASEIFRDGLLDGQVVLLSGGGSGIGRCTALELAALGARVTICGRRLEPLLQTAGLLGSAGGSGSIEAVACDVREEDQVAALVAGVIERHGQIDVLVNNAGGQFLAPAESISPKGFRTVIRLNVESAWLMSHAVATACMIERGGKIINITLSPHNGMPGMVHSGAARAAVENMTRTLSIEWARFKILVNAIAAGQIETETMRTKYPPKMVAGVAATVPLGRLGTEEEMAWQIAYLASKAGDFTSGAVFTVDGARDNGLGGWPPSDMRDDSGDPLAEQRRG
ncbi:MAG: SDR family oxidoreductase [Solirubrobacteraceae bacterium]